MALVTCRDVLGIRKAIGGPGKEFVCFRRVYCSAQSPGACVRYDTNVLRIDSVLKVHSNRGSARLGLH